MYEKAGINDVKKFYAEKFVYNQRYDFFETQLAHYNISFSKHLWIYRNVKPESKVLDFGCGSGTLSILKRKGCKITGLDLSEKALDIAMKVNGYDSVYCGNIFEFDHEIDYFDYIVSLDVFGHVPFEEKDSTIQELKKYLNKTGVMLHGIECGIVNYSEMSNDKLKAFIEVDGHIGIESKQNILDRFGKYFNYVEGEVRFTVENSVDEYIKQAESYSAQYDEQLLKYLKRLNQEEKMAFNVANGLVQLKMEQMKYPSPDNLGGFFYLKASDVPIADSNFNDIGKENSPENVYIADRIDDVTLNKVRNRIPFPFRKVSRLAGSCINKIKKRFL